MKSYSVRPEAINSYLDSLGSAPLRQPVKLMKVLLRPKVNAEALAEHLPELKAVLDQYPKEFVEYSEIKAKYAGYIKKEEEQVEKMNRLESVRLPENFNYHAIQGLSAEGQEKLSRIRPGSIGQASRISGVSASDISILLVYMGR